MQLDPNTRAVRETVGDAGYAVTVKPNKLTAKNDDDETHKMFIVVFHNPDRLFGGGQGQSGVRAPLVVSGRRLAGRGSAAGDPEGSPSYSSVDSAIRRIEAAPRQLTRGAEAIRKRITNV